MSLPEDTIDDILYLARTGEASELREVLEALSRETGTPAPTLLLKATDAHTGNTALHYAAANGHLEILDLIAELCGLSPSSPTSSTTTPSTSASPAHPVIAARNHARNTPLHYAALNGHLAAVQRLVERWGADPAALNDAGHDAVYEAEVGGKEEVVGWLLERGGEGLERGVAGGEGEGDAGEDDGEEEEEEVRVRMGEMGVQGEEEGERKE